MISRVAFRGGGAQGGIRPPLCLVCIRNTWSIWYFIQFVLLQYSCISMGPAGACIPVASASPIHVLPIRVLKHCGAHKHNIYI